MAFSSDTFGRGSFKRLNTLAHTSNDRDPSNESILSGPVVPAGGSTTAETIDNSQAQAITDGTVEIITFDMAEVSGSNDAGYEASFPAGYSGAFGGGAAGELLRDYSFAIPKAFSSPVLDVDSDGYNPILKNAGATQISESDSCDWYWDETAGVAVCEDPDAGSTNWPPATIKCCIYIGETIQVALDAKALTSHDHDNFSQNTDGFAPGPSTADISSDYVLQADGDWVANAGGGGGETNTGSDLGGTAGTFKQKTGVDLEFRGISDGGSSHITVAENATDIGLSITADAVDTTELADDGVTNTKLDNMLALTIKGNDTGALGNPKDLTVAETKAMLDLAGSDTDAIHDNVSSEISAVASKATPVAADLLLIEDTEDTNAKKKITLADVPSAVAVYLAASSVTLNNGTSSDGVADLQAINDGLEYHVDEATGEPGMDLEVDFTGVTVISRIVVRAYYEGGTTHGVQIQLWNFSDSGWETIHTLSTCVAYQQHFKTIIDGDNYISGGNATMRFWHEESGTASHDLYIDYAALGYNSLSTSLAHVDTTGKQGGAAGEHYHLSAAGYAANVYGATASDDNAIVRYHTTAGLYIQNSDVTIDDSGNVTLASGNIVLTTGGATVDGVDLTAHDADADAHHNEDHALTTHSDIATDTIVGRDTAGTGAPEVLTLAEVRTMLVETYTAVAIASGDVDPDVSTDGFKYTIDLDQACTVNVPANIASGMMVEFRFVQDTGGSNTVTWHADYNVGDITTTVGEDGNEVTYVLAKYNEMLSEMDIVAINPGYVGT